MRPDGFSASRVAARVELLAALIEASQRHKATAAHLLGSLGRQEADALSDIDAWLTFPDNRIAHTVRRRHALHREDGDLLLTHETAGNRPLGGVYTLALYQTSPAQCRSIGIWRPNEPRGWRQRPRQQETGAR